MSKGLPSWLEPIAALLRAPEVETTPGVADEARVPNQQPTAMTPSEQYLLDEYDHVAQAHFETISSISTFFKHYLLIMSVPITLAVAVLSSSSMDMSRAAPYVPFPTAVVAVIGLLVCIYIVNLRFDVLLYARTINAIRKYFFDKLGTDAVATSYVRVLPQSRYVPAYHERFFFFPVVVAFALIDGAYFGLATALAEPSTATWPAWGWLQGIAVSLLSRLPGFATWSQIRILPAGTSLPPVWFGVILGSAFAGIHFWVYSAVAAHREANYLVSRSIGVDIDGVLNEHREMFCRKLKQHTGKTMHPNEITAMPVHLCDGTDVTRADEVTVFNDPLYWVEMPVLETAVDTLVRIRDELGYDVTLFTKRDWPDVRTLQPEQGRETERTWRAQAKAGAVGSWFAKRAAGKDPHPMTPITRQWLDKQGLGEFPVVVEKRCRPKSSSRHQDRFVTSARRGLRVFVEDDPDNARKLAFNCDLVLLIAHPYNADGPLPKNVIRVAKWRDVYSVLSRLPEIG